MQTYSLNGTWDLRGRPQDGAGEELRLTATVPGCVQLDLSEAGYLPQDLFYGNNVRQTEAYETWEWWLERRFTAPAEREEVFLVFEGVDCVAHYYLNGVKLGDSENMFIAHEFEVGRYLQDGGNVLTVHIESPVIAAFREGGSLNGAYGWCHAQEGVALRRAPHSYGWDIMPRAITSGLWRGVRLEVRDPVRFEQAFFVACSTRCLFSYELCCEFSDLAEMEIEIEGRCKDSRFCVRKQPNRCKTGTVEFTLDAPYRWWPYGYGDPDLYDASARIYVGGRLVHEYVTRFGYRDVWLDRTDSLVNGEGRFRFLINGVEVMCKGSNWVPLDAFHSRDAARLDEALALVKDIGCNVLRCWGGNVYEDHAFFDFCDENGIMVWQDFAMACASYPQNDRFARLLEQEATAVVRKLRQHPSLILWAGDNEVDLMSRSAGLDPSHNRLTREILPRVVYENDKFRPYLPSSPYLSDEVYRSGRLDNWPEDHLWGPRDYFKGDYYKNATAVFASETGYHGCPSLASIKKFITPEKVWPTDGNEEWILHSSDQDGNDFRVKLMEKQVLRLFGEVFTDPEDYVLASQISQAEAKKYFIERMRAGRPQKSGIIWWNLLDGWPQMSDAVVDYYFDKKRAYAYIKRSQAPFILMLDEPQDGVLRLLACNDTLTEKNGRYTVQDGRTDEVLAEGTFTAAVNGTTTIASLPSAALADRYLILRWEADGESGYNHFVTAETPLDLREYRAFMEKFDL